MAKFPSTDPSIHQFPVVGIGASAGGLEAFKTFLKALPAKSGMAYVFIQHLSPVYDSNLPEILAKVAPFPVHEITDNIHLEQDHLYIIPENKIVTAVDGVLKLSPLEKRSTSSNTIDLFFSSLGVVYQGYAIGVILSGSLSDGTLGMQVIKSYGGLTFAQEESSAEFESMPRSAIRSGAVDFILTPEKIAAYIITINYPFHADYTRSGGASSDEIKHDDEIFRQILILLRVRRGVDFTYYKQNTIKRRVIRRMALGKIEKPDDYLSFLRENKGEQDALYNDMLISVTNFFRDPQSFNFLSDTILPALIRKKTNGEPLRIWVAGCATGEEAYSIAICLQEYLGDKAAAIKIQIFATDISETAIARARTGIYRPSDLEGLSSSRILQFFTKLDGNYQVSKAIRDMCVFAHHNLLKDPPFSKIDLVTCRNVMIYLEPVLQKKALSIFHYSLNESGFLMLGKSESIGISTDIFAAYNNVEKIYLKKGSSARILNVASYGREQNFRNIDKSFQKESVEKDIHKMADEAILANFMPASVLVNEKFDIIQFRGTTETWLVPPAGKPTYNILKMAREGLSFELRNLLMLANKTNAPVHKFSVFFKVGAMQHFVNLHAVPLKATEEYFCLVVFQAASATGIQQVIMEGTASPETANYNETEMRVEQLERELTQARTDMRAITEEQETANEELQSANEELLSGSEELQSLNEELETSKEELQSINEEIMIVNKELLDRNEQLNKTRLYTESIVNTIRDPLLILDKELRVKRATLGFLKKFRLTETETDGQFIYDVGNGLWNIPRLRELLEKLLPARKELNDFEVIHVFPILGKRIFRLNAKKIDNVNGEELIILSIEDLTGRQEAEDGGATTEK
jgi:two-component system CheB/CheR fusion protein